MRFIISLYFLILGLSSTAQWVPLHAKLDIRYGNDSVRSKFLVTDYRGIVWIGTNLGLQKISGQNLSPTIKIPDQLSTATTVDTTMWLGTETGNIYIFNPINEKIEYSFALSDSSAISAIYAYQDIVLVSTLGEGMFLISKNDTIHFNAQNSLSDNYIYNAEIYNDEVICGSDRGIDVINLKTKSRTQHYESSITKAISVNDTLAIAASHRFGLISINLNNFSENHFLIDAENSRVFKIKKGLGRTFVLTTFGIFEYANQDQTQAIFEKHGILDFVILNEGIILALCEDKSIVMIDLRFSKIENRKPNNYTAITVNNDKLYTAGTEGISSLDIESGTEQSILPNTEKMVVVCMAVSKNNLFIGTFNRGLLAYNFQSKTLLQLDTASGLPDNNVLSMTSRNDTLWFATLSGISALTPDMLVIQYPNSGRMQSTYIYSVLALDTCLLIGTDGKGLFNFKNNAFLDVPFANNIRDETIYHISKDGSGGLWFVTKNYGLMKLEENNSTLIPKFSEKNIDVMAAGGPESSAIAIGQGWLKLFFNNQSLFLENEKTFGQISGDYLNNISYGGGSKIFFASKNQIYSFEPQSQFVAPAVYLESFQTNMQKVQFSESKLDSDINHIVYSFGAIWYQGLENVKFRYRLKGLDEEWNETTGTTAVYPNLRYGTYTFEVEAGLGEQYYAQSLYKHVFTISKPIYLRWWFIAFSLLLIFVLGYFMFQWQITRTRQGYKREKKRIEGELAVLRNQVNPHFLFNSLNTLMNLIETEPREAEEYLQRLSDFYRKILENKDDHVVSVRIELKNLEEYIYLQKKRFGAALNLKVTLNNNALNSKIPSLTFQLLAENAIKHNVVSRNNPLNIEVSNTENHILFYNIKAPLKNKAAGTGLGLENIEMRYRIIFNQNVNFLNNEKDFIVKLPIAYL